MSEDTAAASASVGPGDRISGYRLEEQIGKGGMAVVYRAHDERLDRRVALKVLAPGLAADTAFRTRFIRESRAAAAVDHPNVIPVYDAGDAGGFLFISMRYVHGGDVRTLIGDGQPLPPARAWHIISQVASALDAAHEHGLVHRDVKPANILLDAGSRPTAPSSAAGEDESHDHVYLSDFGISKRTLASNLTSTGQFVGTLDYIAPEQVEGHAIDGRADQYSLACAAFELLCAEPPFRRSLGLALINAHLSDQPPSLVAKRHDLPGIVDSVLAKAMAKRPAQRYATCEQFAADLGRALGLIPGPVGAAVPPVGQDQGGPPVKPWPATELAQTPPGPVDASTGQPALGPAAASAGLVGEPTAMAGQETMPGPADAPASPGLPQGQGVRHEVGVGQEQGGGTPRPTAPLGAVDQQGPAGLWQGHDQAAGDGRHPRYQGYPMPGGIGGPSGPGWPAAAPAGPPKRSRGVLIGAVVATVAIAAAAVVVVAVLKPTSGNKPTPNNSSASSPASSSPSTAQGQADAMNNVLVMMQQTHQTLQSAVLDIEDNCSVLSSSQMSSDVAAIKTAVNQRQAEDSQAQGIDVSALPSGALLQSDLVQALNYSLHADQHYLTWAQQEQTGCFLSSQSSAYVAANNDSQQANVTKAEFANLWDQQVAPAYNEPAVSSTSL